jgi:hypothetical protein
MIYVLYLVFKKMSKCTLKIKVRINFSRALKLLDIFLHSLVRELNNIYHTLFTYPSFI